MSERVLGVSFLIFAVVSTLGLLISSSLKPNNTAKQESYMHMCKENSDCTAIADPCGIHTIAANKKYLKKIEENVKNNRLYGHSYKCPAWHESFAKKVKTKCNNGWCRIIINNPSTLNSKAGKEKNSI